MAGEELIPRVHEIVNICVAMLEDQTSSMKREAALETLGNVVSNTAEVIQPYMDHPHLMATLFRLLKLETNQPIRLDVIKTLGLLGALDPFKQRVSGSWQQ